MIRLTLAILASLVVLTVLVLGVRGTRFEKPPVQFWADMTHQPKVKAQSRSVFFADGQAMRTPPAGTVPWGRSVQRVDASHAVSDETRFAAKTMPAAVDRALLLRGQRLYAVNCMVCHGQTGAGDGITTRYGLINPPSFAAERLVAASDGELYQTITQGKGKMGPYADRLTPDERWAVVAYLRVLQKASTASPEDVPPAQRRQLEEATP